MKFSILIYKKTDLKISLKNEISEIFKIVFYKTIFKLSFCINFFFCQNTLYYITINVIN